MGSFEQRAAEHLVAVGATDAHSVRLWVRSHPGRHLLELERADRSDRRTADFVVPDDPRRDGIVSLRYPTDFDGAPLASCAAYRFRITRDGLVVGEGRFSTAPASRDEAPDRFAFAILSCHQPFTSSGALEAPSMRMLSVLERALVAEQVERVFLVGDQMYADYPEGLSLFAPDYFARVAPPGRADVLSCTADEVRALYQQRYRIFWSLEPIRRVLASWPCHAVLDDHEVVDNFGSIPEHATERWAALREGALNAAWDYQGLLARARTTTRPSSLHFAVDYGPVSVFVCDLRSERRRDGDTLRSLSEAQLTDLEHFLRTHTTQDVVMIGLSVPLVHVPDWLADLGAAVGSGDAADRWSIGRADADRQRLVDLLRDHQARHPRQRMVLFGGDIHVGAAHVVHWHHDPELPPVVQLVSSAVSNTLSPVASAVAGLLPRLGTRRDYGPSMFSAELLAGVEGSRNPYTGLNVGIVSFVRVGDGFAVRLRLLGVDDGEPAQPVVVFDSGLLDPPRAPRGRVS